MRVVARFGFQSLVLYFLFAVPGLEASSRCFKFLEGWSGFKPVAIRLQSHFDKTTPAEKRAIQARFTSIIGLPGSPTEINTMLTLSRGQKPFRHTDYTKVEMATVRGFADIREFLELAQYEPQPDRAQLNVSRRTRYRAVLGNLAVGLVAWGSNQVNASLVPWVMGFGMVGWNGYVYSKHVTEIDQNRENEVLERLDQVVWGSQALAPGKHIVLHRRTVGQPDRVYVLLTCGTDGELVLDVVRWAFRVHTEP